MEELLAYTSSHVCLICFLLALTFIFSKIKMFKLLFILFVIKQRNIGCHYLFSQANYCRTRESWVVITEIEIIFACIYFCELKKSYFASTYFCEWQVFENFEFINFTPPKKKNKKKTVESWDMRLMFLWRETEKQEGHDERLLLLMILKKTELTNIFFEHIFLYLFSGNMNFLHI